MGPVSRPDSEKEDSAVIDASVNAGHAAVSVPHPCVCVVVVVVVILSWWW